MTKESLTASFFIKFKDLKLNTQKAKEHWRHDIILKNKYFKHISLIVESSKYIYFQCVGPSAYRYLGFIAKQTGEVKFGRE